LGKEIVIEAQRLGVETIVLDRYHNPPAAQVAHRHYAVNMLDGDALKAIIRREKPDLIVPEIEAINTDALVELEREGFFVIPNARATKTTMDRIAIRKLAKESGVNTSDFEFVFDLDIKNLSSKENYEKVYAACEKITKNFDGRKSIVKPLMTSGGMGATIITKMEDVKTALENLKFSRGRYDSLIVEGWINFDLEVTELALRHLNENGETVTSFPKPIGHVRPGNHYHESWQPFLDKNVEFRGIPNSRFNGQKIDEGTIEKLEKKIYEMSKKITDQLGGLGLFGCEIFVDIENNEVYFNEISPRPHDTGMVTLITQDLSEAALHTRAILGLPIPKITLLSPGASHVILAEEDGKWAPKFGNIDKALAIPGVHLRFFGKSITYKDRRLGLALAIDDNINFAREKAEKAAHFVESRISY
jgi:phosphoribosylglycinamide formyltransferase 2